MRIGKIQLRVVYNLYFRHYCSNTGENIIKTTAKCAASNIKGIPEPPTTCCMSGCPNCVWLEYAEKLTDYFKDGGERALKEINTHVTDPSVKAYLLHELRMRNNNK